MADFAVLCPGQGGQSPGMFDFALADARGREVIESIQSALGVDLVARARANDRLFDNDFAQTALVTAALASWAVLSPDLPPPLLFAGYSVGELSAWGCAGAWSAQACARLAVERARIMDAHSPAGCGMLAVRGVGQAEVASLASGLHIAIVNSEDHYVLAGSAASVDAAERFLVQRGGNTRRLDVHVPSHTPWLAGATPEFGSVLASAPASLRTLAAPVLRGIDGRRACTGADMSQALSRAVSETIRWDLCQREIVESGAQVLLELGPGRSLCKIMSEENSHASIAARSVADFRSAEGVLRWVERQLAG